MTGRRRAVVVAAGLACLLAAVLTGRMLWGARAQLALADEARQRGAADLEIVQLRRAMAYFVPGNPWVDQARAKIIQRAQQAEAAGQSDRALRIWHELRSAILALRGAYSPFAAELPEINRRIAALSPDQPNAAAHLRTATGQRALLQRLQQPRQPRPGWTAVALAGFVLWLAAAGLLIARGLTPEARGVARRWGWLSLLLLCAMGLFFGGLALA